MPRHAPRISSHPLVERGCTRIASHPLVERGCSVDYQDDSWRVQNGVHPLGERSSIGYMKSLQQWLSRISHVDAMLSSWCTNWPVHGLSRGTRV